MEIIDENQPLHEASPPPNLKPDVDSFVNVISSERLSKDVESLMNSSFWINALKNSRAFGIGSDLYCNFYSHEKYKNTEFR